MSQASLIPPARLVIASRESALAMWQAEHIRDRLRALYPQTSVSILGMTTQGDQILNVTLSKIGGKGLFVKELEEALLGGASYDAHGTPLTADALSLDPPFPATSHPEAEHEDGKGGGKPDRDGEERIRHEQNQLRGLVVHVRKIQETARIQNQVRREFPHHFYQSLFAPGHPFDMNVAEMQDAKCRRVSLYFG